MDRLVAGGVLRGVLGRWEFMLVYEIVGGLALPATNGDCGGDSLDIRFVVFARVRWRRHRADRGRPKYSGCSAHPRCCWLNIQKSQVARYSPILFFFYALRCEIGGKIEWW